MAIDTDYTEINRRRRRDIAILASGSILLLLVLWVTGALGWIECLTAVLLIAGGAFAYHVGIVASARVHRPAIRTRSPRSSRANQHQAQQMIIAALQQPAMVIDAAGGLVVYNLSAAEIFNLPAGRMGFSAASLRHPELLTSVERVLSEGGSVTCELSAVRQPGQVWLAKVTELVSGDTVRAVLVVMTDQGPVRRAEKARADFLANASHELRTPLTSISGFLETMQGAAREDREAWPRFVDIMADQTAHMRDLISDLLSLSRIELSEHKAPTTEVDFANIVNEVIEAMMPVAEARGVALCVEGEAGPLPMVAVEGEVKQVVQNLLSNALKYSAEGSEIHLHFGGATSLDAAEDAASRTWSGASRAALLLARPTIGAQHSRAVWLRIRDHGPGIDEAFLPRLGERFFRVDASRGGPVEGTGLGLAIVKHIMAHHRGGLAVESIPDEGSLFSLWMPALVLE